MQDVLEEAINRLSQFCHHHCGLRSQVSAQAAQLSQSEVNQLEVY